MYFCVYLCIFMYIYAYFKDFVVYKYGVRLAARPPGVFRRQKNAHVRDFLAYFEDFIVYK